MVRYKHIKINGREIASNQKVWSLKPFTARLKTAEPVEIEFTVYKPLSIDDCPLAVVVFAVFAFLYFLIVFSLLPKSLIQKLRLFLEKFNQKDLLQIIQNAYFGVDPFLRRSFWIIFACLCFAFGFHTTEYMFGNHDWQYLTYDTRSWSHFAMMGRYALNVVKETFLGNTYLPVVYDVVTFLFMALNAVLLCVYWRLEKRLAYFVLCGLILTAQPFTLTLIYYIHMIPETFMGVTFLLAGLLISEKIGFENQPRKKKMTNCFLAIVLFNLSLAMYPVLINTLAVAFMGRLLIQSFKWDGSLKQFKTLLMPYKVTALNIVLGIVLYKGLLAFMFPVQDLYNTQTLPLAQLPDRILVLLSQSIRQLCGYDYPFISQLVLHLFLILTFVLAVYICSEKNKWSKGLRLLLLAAALFATQTSMIIAQNHIIEARVELFGLVVYETLVAVLFFKEFKKISNICLVAFGMAAFISIINDLDCLRVWKLGFDAEKMLWNRVLTRLEMQENFNPNFKYKIVQIGEPIAMRPKYFGSYSKDFVGGAPGGLTFAYDASWDVFHAYEFYYPTNFRQTPSINPETDDKVYLAELKRLYDAGVLDKAQAWPHPKGLIVLDDVILYVTDQKALEKYKQKFLEESKHE